MTQNGLKHILNIFLKSVTKTDLDPPSRMHKMLHFFLRLPLDPVDGYVINEAEICVDPCGKETYENANDFCQVGNYTIKFFW